jgi:hypothetical protein
VPHADASVHWDKGFDMILAKWPQSRAVFDRFLYAGVGADANGMEITVLSALARRDVDPWEAAAEMSRISSDKALGKLVAMLETLPGLESLAGRTAVAGRLIPLLPRAAEVSALAANSVRREPTAKPRIDANVLGMVCAWFLAMFLVSWWLVENSSNESVAASATTAAAVATTAPAANAAPSTEQATPHR